MYPMAKTHQIQNTFGIATADGQSAESATNLTLPAHPLPLFTSFWWPLAGGGVLTAANQQWAPLIRRRHQGERGAPFKLQEDSGGKGKVIFS